MKFRWKRKLKRARRKYLRARFHKVADLANNLSFYLHEDVGFRYVYYHDRVVAPKKINATTILYVRKNSPERELIFSGTLNQIEDYLTRLWNLKAFL